MASTTGGIDSYGVYFDVGLTATAAGLGLSSSIGVAARTLVRMNTSSPNPGSGNLGVFRLNYLYSTQPPIPAAGPIPADHERIHYHRSDGVYAGWTVTPSTIRPRTQGISTDGPVQVSGLDSYGVYFDVGLTAGATDLGFIIHRGGEKDPGPDMHVNPQTQGFEIWIVSGSTTINSNLPTAAQLLAGELSKLQAIWIDPATIVLPRTAVQPGMSYALTVDPNAAITLSSTGVSGGTTSTLNASWAITDHRSTGAVSRN